MSLLSAIPVFLLAVVAIWFIWPMIVDPIARQFSRRSKSEPDHLAEQFFAMWSKHGQGTRLLIRSERN